MQNVYVMELPQMKRPQDVAFYRAELDEFRGKVEELTGKTLTAETLKAAIKEVNDKRRALQRIAATRAASPAPISGKDALLATQVAFYDDVPRYTQMMNTLADELEQRVADGVGVAPAGAKRILITGTPMALPNWKLHDIIEKSGGIVVGEEMCTGSRYYDALVPEDGETVEEMFDAIADKYMDINCACFTPNQGRIDDIVRMAKEFNADGVIDYALNFCATVPDRGVHRREDAAGGRHPGPEDRHRLLRRGHRSALDARRGVPRDDLVAMRFSDSISVRAVSMPCGSTTAASSSTPPSPTPASTRPPPRASSSSVEPTTCSDRHRLRPPHGSRGVRLRRRDRDQGVRHGCRRALPAGALACSTSAARTPRSSRWERGGKVVDFEMNDKCAAGTGKFLEVMARALGYSLEEMAAAALAAERTVAISSMCTVFAESEVTGLVHRGEDRSAIARGLHESIAKRTVSSLKRVGATGPLVFAGGVAKNPAMVELIREGFAGEVVVPGDERHRLADTGCLRSCDVWSGERRRRRVGIRCRCQCCQREDQVYLTTPTAHLSSWSYGPRLPEGAPYLSSSVLVTTV